MSSEEKKAVIIGLGVAILIVAMQAWLNH